MLLTTSVSLPTFRNPFVARRTRRRSVWQSALTPSKGRISSSSSSSNALELKRHALVFSESSTASSSASMRMSTRRAAKKTRDRRGVTTNASVDNAESIARKVSRTAAACKTLGRWGFWGQLILFTVAAVVVVFSLLFKGFTKATDAGLYFILFGIMAGFFTTFWSLGLVRLGDRLKTSIADLELVPPRAEVVKALTTGLTVNLVGLGATIVGLQATTGLLFAKTLTIAATGPFTPNANPVLALDIFLVQAASNAMLAHWLGMSISLWLLRTVNLPSPAAPKGEK